MSGAMRKIGEYLGLLEDTGRYDDVRRRATTSRTSAASAAPARRPRAAEPRRAPVADLAERRRTAAGTRPPRAVVAELSRITTLHPRTYNEARVDRRELPRGRAR